MREVTLIPNELAFPKVGIIDSKVLGDYNEGIGSYKGRARQALDIFSDRSGELAGSNCFAPIMLRKYLSPEERLATMVDLGTATEINPNFLRGCYSDTGLTLVTAGDSYKENDFLAKDLARQLEKRNITLKFPKIIYFDALDFGEDANSSYGLAYNLSERAQLGKNIFDASESSKDFIFKIMDSRGVPVFDENGTRTYYTRNDGLSRFYLGGDSIVGSNGRDLAYSYDNGRVVVVRAPKAV